MLSWQYALAAAGVLVLAAATIRAGRLAARPGGHPRAWALWGGVAWEAALLFGLYALWQFAGSFTVMGTSGAIPRARWLWQAERFVRLPSETALQHPFLSHPQLVQASNLYYDILHFPLLGACLIWLYARHRESYPRVRTTIALFTGASLLIQLIPVAPPRLLPMTGMVDTAVQYGQSVYSWSGGFDADEFSAMPSVHAGWALPLASVFALAPCLLCAWCIGLLAREMPASGSLATYAARGLHPSVGFLVAWGYVLVGWLIPPLVLLQLGFTTAATINSEFHGYPANLWWPWSLAGAVIVLAAGYFGVRASTRFGTILGISEIAVFLVLAVFFVVHAGSHNTAQVFTTHYSPTGLTGVIGGSVFTLLAFGGFEGAAPLAEEARDPRRTIRRAVLLATLLIGLLYVFTTYAVDVAYGPKGFTAFATFTGNASWEGLARSLYGLFWFFVFLAIVNSTIANANAGVNVSSRTAYAMGRIGAFPRFLAIVSPRHRSPVNSVLVAFVITVAVTLGLGLGYDPTVAFTMVATGLVIVLVAIYILMNAACLGFFARRGMGGFNWLSHLLVPLLGIAAFVPAWLTAAGIKVFSFVTPLAPPLSYMGPGVAGFMVVGVIYMIYLYRTNPQRVSDVGLVHLDALEETT